jgi:hypothetical protein
MRLFSQRRGSLSKAFKDVKEKGIVCFLQHNHQRRYEENKMQTTHAPAVALLATS